MKKLIVIILFLQLMPGFAQTPIKPPTIWVYITDVYTKTSNGKPIYYNRKNNKQLNSDYAIFLKRTKHTDTPIKDYFEYIVAEGNFKNGYKDGLWKTTYENKLVKTENYNNGLMVGRYKVYNTKGDTLYQTTFGPQGNGKYQDYYYNTGILKEEGFYKNGKKDGEWCSFDEEGTLIESIDYRKGVPIEKE